jgi:hypothetical protein
MPNREDAPTTGDPRGRPFPESLCWRCANRRAVAAARSVFLMCTALPVKYPRQPIAICSTFRLED